MKKLLLLAACAFAALTTLTGCHSDDAMSHDRMNSDHMNNMNNDNMRGTRMPGGNGNP